MKNRKMYFFIVLILAAIVLSMCNKKAKEQESKANSVTESVKTETQQYNSESDFKIDWDPNVKDGIIIAKYIGDRSEVKIPLSIQNDTVTGIGKEAFYEKHITSVDIPDGVTNIGNSAFKYCTSLKNVIIPDSVTSIGYEAFYNCYELTSIKIPNGVTKINQRTFSGCRELTSIYIPDSVTYIADQAFSHSGLISITIPNSVTSIPDYAFSSCSKLTSITIPSNIRVIMMGAFYDCKNLTTVTFQGKIAPNSFLFSTFPGNLRDVYLASDGGPGTYTRLNNGETWRKQ